MTTVAFCGLSDLDYSAVVTQIIGKLPAGTEKD